MMNLLIIEPEAGGHHFAPYVQFFVREAARRGWNVRLMTTTKSAAHAAFKIVEAEMPDKLTITIMPEPANTGGTGLMSLFKKQMAYRKAMTIGFNKLSPQEVPDFVYIMNCDAVDKALSVLGSPFGKLPFAGMFIANNYHRYQMGIGPARGQDKLIKWLFERLLRIESLVSVTVIDEYFVEYAHQQTIPGYRKVKYVPDPGELHGIETQAQVREQWEIPEDRFVILVYGALHKRKGIKELLDAVCLLNSDSPVSVLLAGQMGKDIVSLLQQPMAEKLLHSGRLIVVPGFQNQEQEYRLFRAANTVWVGYVGGFYGRSAVMVQAGSIGLPVLACDVGLIGAIVGNKELGLVFNPENTALVAENIHRLQSDLNLQKRLGQNGRLFAKQATAEKFGSALCEAADIIPGVDKPSA